nr:MAG TPA: hypothetical protein [Caudoviricetes sp.]
MSEMRPVFRPAIGNRGQPGYVPGGLRRLRMANSEIY